MGLSSEFPWQFRVLAALRTPLMVFIVVPLSFLSWLVKRTKVFFRSKQSSADIKAEHEKAVESIMSQIVTWNKAGRKTKMRTARPNWMQMSTKLASNKEDCHLIDVRGMDRILNVDFDNLTLTGEPSVTMGQITDYLLPLGYALAVQVEMESITLGGLTNGFGMETTSHISGFFQETIVGFELVGSYGRVHQIDKKSDPDFFYALPWSHGTLGYLTSVTVKIVKIKPFVLVTYIPTFSPEELQAKMTELAESDDAPDFLEATLYSRDTAVIQTGRYASQEEANKGQVNKVNLWYKPFYYKWVETFLDKGEGSEYIPLKHYYHRFSRSIFWEIEDMIPFANHPLYRFFWGWMGAPEVSLLKLFQGPVIRKSSIYAHVVQESIMPVRRIAEGVKGFEKWFDVYPLLCFPLKVYDRGDHSGFLHPRKENLAEGKDWGIWVDIGAYGVPRKVREGKPWDPKTEIREMEHWTRDVGGWQATYTDLFCTEKEFRQMFDHSLLDKVQTRLKCTDAFPSVYQKVGSEKGLIDLSDVQ